MKSSRGLIIIIILLLIVIAVLSWLLFVKTAEAPALSAPATSATATTTTTPTLITRARVASPQPGAILAKTFAVTGVAPNAWYFEAVFPIQVRDADDNLLASAQAQAQSDWTVAGPVSFTASVTISSDYHGPATLILLKDNPSGLPENSDEVTIPITIK